MTEIKFKEHIYQTRLVNQLAIISNCRLLVGIYNYKVYIYIKFCLIIILIYNFFIYFVIDIN